ncbi:hypothetical protein CHGG_06279 [Chaetomium globosum CBS 148.51]|uniref:Amidohydrolase-related domain-containing protein n=1 Tax=Chaetomium globosum (strain ATCC 6205 / CBS 148.51 / DSM 1962 / NBRC 6347 / NRRL 1970) TaxID=306901 RepID=Q2H4Y6_CHAGB|nr:uncharacterized protein CHGG_06279 [Chaetomium globosum CBS 148.51]EAQ89660.1 hypothetical protein CHGG_06279 [Chaetomium globosum CBS 148.51]
MSPLRSILTVHTSLLFDPIQKSFLENVSVEVNTVTGAIIRLHHRNTPDLTSPLSNRDIDLRGKRPLPLPNKCATSPPSSGSCAPTTTPRAALMAGYTTYRDLGTEALGNADANFRDCVNRGLTPGPRLFVATEALASSGGYEIRTESKLAHGGPLGLSLPRAADLVDGVWGVRGGVRRRVGEGADVLKFYADYRRRVMRFPPDVRGPGGTVLFPPDRRERNPAVVLFSQEEMDAIVVEAKLADIPVAAHAAETSTALMAARAGVTTVEHVFADRDGCMEAMVEAMVSKGTIWVPTLATAEEGFEEEKYNRCKAAVKAAFEKGVRVATGGDTGVFNHGLNCREMEIMIEAGIPLEDVLVAATHTGWHACGGDASGFRFGWWDEGNRADIVALDTDPRKDAKAFRKVNFVMKDARVWKRDGQPVDMVPASAWQEEAALSIDEESARCKQQTVKVSNHVALSIRGSGNPTPAASDVGWETDSFDVKLA